MQALVLDFDGVIADTAPETFEVGLRTYRDLFPDAALDRFDRHRLEQGFRALMPLGNRAEDFGVALRALDQEVELADQAAYDAFRQAFGRERLQAFHHRFYQHRAAFARDDPAGWRALMAPYDGFVSLLRRRRGQVPYAIATAKDRASVSALLEDWGLRDLFDEGRIADKETGESKVRHLERLQRALDLPFAGLTFVDDKVNHLEAVAPLGVRCGLAAWGYNGPREHAVARERGHLVCTVEDAEPLLFGADPA